MKDRSTSILGMLHIYLVYEAPRGVVWKWLLTPRNNSASFMYGYETRTHVPELTHTHTYFYVSVVHIIRGKYEGCRDLHRSFSVVRAVRFMEL